MCQFVEKDKAADAGEFVVFIDVDDGDIYMRQREPAELVGLRRASV
jgi:hypothetical protein